jgi:hypothetical protein
MDYDNGSSLLMASIPNEILNKECEVSYRAGNIIVTPLKTYDVTDEFNSILGNTIDDWVRVWPANWDGRNDSNIPLVSIQTNNGGEVSSKLYEILVDTVQNTVTFSQLGPSSLDMGHNGQKFAYNGKFVMQTADKDNQNSDHEYFLIERGVQGFTIIEPKINSNGIDLNNGYISINHSNAISGGPNQILSLENGNFLLIGSIGSGAYAMVYDPETKSFVERFGDYRKPSNTGGEDDVFSDYYGCETSEPNANVVPADQFNERNQFTCKNIKDIRLAIGSNAGGITGRYGDWILSGLEESVDFGWQKNVDVAWNSKTFESTGVLSCYPHTKPGGTSRGSDQCGRRKHHSAFRNIIITISNNGRLYTRYNLDDQSEDHVDITNLGIVAGDDFNVFKDLVMIDVTESSDGDRIWLEINFEDNAAYDRGVIEDGGLKVVKFVQ